MERGTTMFLKIAVFIIGTIVLILCLFWLPGLASDAAKMNPEYGYLRLPLLIGLYMTAIPFFLALYQTWKLLNYIGSGHAFSERTVSSLGHIKNDALLIVGLYVIGMILLLLNNALHPGIAILGSIIVFSSVVISVFAAVLEELLRSSLEIKSENDLTV